jgi:hypothetical protein
VKENNHTKYKKQGKREERKYKNGGKEYVIKPFEKVI